MNDGVADSQSRCEYCDDEGYVVCRDRFGRTRRVVCERCDAAAKNKRGAILRGASFPSVAPTPFWRDVAEYVDRFDEISKTSKNWLLLAGKTGSGKTTQAVNAAREIASRNLIPTKYFNAVELFRRLRASTNRAQDFETIFDSVATKKLAVVDDVLKYVPSRNSFDYETYKSVIVEFFWIRYEKRLPTIITTQSTLNDLQEFDDALFGRIIESSRIKFINETATNWRLVKSKGENNET